MHIHVLYVFQSCLFSSEIDDEETSDTDGDREEVEDGSFA